MREADMSVADSPLAPPSSSQVTFAHDVREGLTAHQQKRLPPKYLYDALGSVLFEAITQLPEYGLWRAERTLLSKHAEEIATLAAAHHVIELGSGSASKTVHVLQALLRRHPLSYCSVDLSAAAIAMTQRELSVLPGLSIRSVENDYLAGLEGAMQAQRANERTLVLFLGSSLGNFADHESAIFLQRIRRALRPGDALLLGADLLKPVEQMLAAYADPLGVTAAFNLNLLLRMNRDLNANFVISQFRHAARFNAATRDVEMHIEARHEHSVEFRNPGFTVHFHAGETIHTESSHKYSLAELNRIVEHSGFQSRAGFLDSESQFVNCLYLAI
jgi:L-histidine N-alpha-methyltransferase